MRPTREVLVLVHRGEQVLVLRRVPEDPYWHVVAGGVEEGETELEGAARELLEETGLDASGVACDAAFRPRRLRWRGRLRRRPGRPEERSSGVSRVRSLARRFRYPIAEEAPARQAQYPPGARHVDVACFAVEAPTGWEPVLNEEHDEYRWCTVEEARALLRWDDVRRALALLDD